MLLRTENVGVVVKNGDERLGIRASGAYFLLGPRFASYVVDVNRRSIRLVGVHAVNGIEELSEVTCCLRPIKGSEMKQIR